MSERLEQSLRDMKAILDAPSVAPITYLHDPSTGTMFGALLKTKRFETEADANDWCAAAEQGMIEKGWDPMDHDHIEGSEDERTDGVEVKGATVIPHRERFLVDPDPAAAASRGGVYLPETSREKVNTGTVVAVGSEVTELAVGDRIVYEMYAGIGFEADGRSLLLMKPGDAVAKYVD